MRSELMKTASLKLVRRLAINILKFVKKIISLLLDNFKLDLQFNNY